MLPLTVQSVVLLVGAFAQDGGGAVVEDGGGFYGRQAAGRDGRAADRWVGFGWTGMCFCTRGKTEIEKGNVKAETGKMGQRACLQVKLVTV